VASITALPFADASFEAVVSADVICRVNNPEVAVAEFYRVLKPGGVLVVNAPAYQWMWSYHDDTCQTQHRYGRRELAALLRAGGGTGVPYHPLERPDVSGDLGQAEDFPHRQ
jgi:SAM-dependent methyltransferase